MKPPLKMWRPSPSPVMLKVRVAALQVVFAFVGLEFLGRQNALHGSFASLGQRGEGGRHRLPVHMPGQR
jgi:hypothetical protein